MKTSIIILFVLAFESCDNTSIDSYSKKRLIATCQENQGMVTFETFLYADSTFYQEGNTLVEKSYGSYKILSNEIYFKTIGGVKNLCEKYIFDSTKHILFPTDNSSDHLNIYFEK